MAITGANLEVAEERPDAASKQTAPFSWEIPILGGTVETLLPQGGQSPELPVGGERTRHLDYPGKWHLPQCFVCLGYEIPIQYRAKKR